MSKSDSELTESNVDFGSTLAATRQTKNYTVDDVREHLKIPHDVIEAIESNNIEALPAAIFTQGYLRAYAKFLEISEDDILEAYNRAVPHGAAANLKSRSSLRNEASSQSPLFKTITLLLVVSGIATLIFGGIQYYQEKADDMETELESRQESFTGHSLDSPAEPQLDIRQNARLTSDDELIVGSVDSIEYSEAENIADESESLATEQTSVSTMSAEKIEEAPVVAVNDVIEILAERGSWVQVRDATNKRLFNNMIPVGGKQKLEGEAPFRISLGNARSTRVLINDLEVDMSNRITRKNIATFTVSTKEQTVFFH